MNIIRVQCLRILLSSFGEEDFQRFTLNLPCSNSFGYYFKDNVGGAGVEFHASLASQLTWGLA